VARTDDPRRHLPGVDSILSHPDLQKQITGMSPEFVAAVVRDLLSEMRQHIQDGEGVPSVDATIRETVKRVAALRQRSLRRVINATGVILHTGLGRAPMSSEIARDVIDAVGYCSLEFDLENGERGNRQTHVRDLLCRLTGAESALVVNNNAAAVFQTLNVLAYKREAIVSRGQLIEIGGSFRLPDIMARSGVKLVEVGTTNRTRLEDYAQAISPKTALLLNAHASNYRIVGFTESVAIAALAELGKKHEIPVIDDIGNGLLWDWTSFGLPAEPNARESLQAGADLVLMSGDKALGGSQAGIILGKDKWIARLEKSPLARVLRCDKLTLAALAASLRLYLDRARVAEKVPVWQMLTVDRATLQERATRVRDKLAPLANWTILEIRDSESETGSGTLPAVMLPSVAVCAVPRGLTAGVWASKLRDAEIPVIGIVRQNTFWMDMRTISDSDEHDLVRMIESVLKRG